MGKTVSGKVGLGSHKHFVSGVPQPHPRYKADRMREANKAIEVARKKSAKRKLEHSSVKELFK